MKKIYYWSIMILSMLFFRPKMVGAQNDVSVWDGTSEIWTQGAGTEENPFHIQNAQQLAYIAQTVNTGVTHYESTYFKLTTNLRIDSLTPWMPIGFNSTNYFSGHFDGDNHIVTIYLNADTLRYVGLFGYVNNSSIKNLGVSGEIHSKSKSGYTGGIAGYCSGHTHLSNCYNTGDIVTYCFGGSGSTYEYYYPATGGLVGWGSGQIQLSNCYNIGNVFAHSIYTSICVSSSICYRSTTGGVIGYCGGGSGYSIISNCYNMGAVSSLTSNSISSFQPTTGGIVGSFSSTQILNSHNTGNVVTVASTYAYAGGIAGSGQSSFISNSYNIGIVSSSTFSSCNPSCAGGIVGDCSMSANNISDCYNTGSVSSSARSESAYSGGLIGYNISSTVSNCYNVGTIAGVNKGGIKGTANGTVSNSYYLNTCGGTVAGGTAKSEAQMKSSSFPVILNADSVVFVKDITPNINQGYPVFGSVRTLDADSICNTTAILHGNYQLLYDVDAHGFEYKLTSESNYTTVTTSGCSPVSHQITQLQSGASYTFRFFVQKDGIYYRGEDKTFNTIQCTLSAQITSSLNTLCEGDTVIYTAIATSSTPTAYQYVWSTGDSLNAISVTDGATYTVTVTDAYGCSATAVMMLTVNPIPVLNIAGNTTICEGDITTLTATGADTYCWSNGKITADVSINSFGVYMVTGTSTAGCSSTASVTVSVTPLPLITIMGETDFCIGESTTLTAACSEDFIWSTGDTSASINVNTAGTYIVTASTSNGCSNSTSVMVIQNQPSPVFITGDTVICNEIGSELEVTPGIDYLWSSGETTQTIYVTNPGVYTVSVTDDNGCVSSATKTISTMKQVGVSGNTSICSGQSTTLLATGEGNYSWSNGTVTPLITVTESGIYTITASLPNGCVSFDSVFVIVNPLPTLSITGNTSFCQGDTTTLTATGASTYVWNNGSSNATVAVNSVGTYTVTGTDANGCTNTATKTITVNPTYNTPLTHSICQGESYNFYGQNLTTAGTYTHTLQTVDGCDSVVTLHLTINHPVAELVEATTCDSYTWNDSVYTQSGDYTRAFTAANGCDSVVTLHLTVNHPTYGDTTVIACESFTWHDSTYTSSDTYQSYLTNAAGCDSIVTLYLTINHPVVEHVEATACENFTWNGTAYTESGEYPITLTSSNGCDSVVTLHLTLFENEASEFTITTNDPCYTWNDVEYCESGDYTQTLETVHGCDSVVTLHLTIGVSIDDYDGFNFKVYPNPTSNIVNVEFGMDNGELGDVEIQLYNVYGKLLDVTNVVGANNHSPLRTAQIDLSRYANGVYVLKAVADGKTVGVRKVVRQ